MSKEQMKEIGNIVDFSKKIRASAELTAKIKSNPKETLKELGFDSGDLQIEVHFSDDKTDYFVLPVSANYEIDDEVLSNLNAAKGSTSGCAGTAGSASTVSTFLTSLGSASSIATAGSASSNAN